MPGLQLEADLAEQDAAGARGGNRDLSTLERPGRGGNSIGSSSSAIATTVSRRRSKRGAGGDDALPIADREIDRRQRPAEAMDAAMIAPAESSPWMVRYAPRPSTADCRIMRSTREIAPNVPLMSLVARLQLQMLAVGLSKRLTARPANAHRLEDLGVAGIGIGDRVARDRRLVRRAAPAAGS